MPRPSLLQSLFRKPSQHYSAPPSQPSAPGSASWSVSDSRASVDDDRFEATERRRTKLSRSYGGSYQTSGSSGSAGPVVYPETVFEDEEDAHRARLHNRDIYEGTATSRHYDDARHRRTYSDPARLPTRTTAQRSPPVDNDDASSIVSSAAVSLRSRRKGKGKATAEPEEGASSQYQRAGWIDPVYLAPPSPSRRDSDRASILSGRGSISGKKSKRQVVDRVADGPIDEYVPSTWGHHDRSTLSRTLGRVADAIVGAPPPATGRQSVIPFPSEPLDQTVDTRGRRVSFDAQQPAPAPVERRRAASLRVNRQSIVDDLVPYSAGPIAPSLAAPSPPTGRVSRKSSVRRPAKEDLVAVKNTGAPMERVGAEPLIMMDEDGNFVFSGAPAVTTARPKKSVEIVEQPQEIVPKRVSRKKSTSSEAGRPSKKKTMVRVPGVDEVPAMPPSPARPSPQQSAPVCAPPPLAVTPSPSRAPQESHPSPSRPPQETASLSTERPRSALVQIDTAQGPEDVVRVLQEAGLLSTVLQAAGVSAADVKLPVSPPMSPLMSPGTVEAPLATTDGVEATVRDTPPSAAHAVAANAGAEQREQPQDTPQQDQQQPERDQEAGTTDAVPAPEPAISVEEAAQASQAPEPALAADASQTVHASEPSKDLDGTRTGALDDAQVAEAVAGPPVDIPETLPSITRSDSHGDVHDESSEAVESSVDTIESSLLSPPRGPRRKQSKTLMRRSRPTSAILLKLEDLLLSPSDGGLCVTGNVSAANFSYQKSVTVRYTLDDWKSHDETAADWLETIDGGRRDRFTFKIDGIQRAEGKRKLVMVARMDSQGFKIWDNNGGKNYEVELDEESLDAADPASAGETETDGTEGDQSVVTAPPASAATGSTAELPPSASTQASMVTAPQSSTTQPTESDVAPPVDAPAVTQEDQPAAETSVETLRAEPEALAPPDDPPSVPQESAVPAAAFDATTRAQASVPASKARAGSPVPSPVETEAFESRPASPLTNDTALTNETTPDTSELSAERQRQQKVPTPEPRVAAPSPDPRPAPTAVMMAPPRPARSLARPKTKKATPLNAEALSQVPSAGPSYHIVASSEPARPQVLKKKKSKTPSPASSIAPSASASQSAAAAAPGWEKRAHTLGWGQGAVSLSTVPTSLVPPKKTKYRPTISRAVLENQARRAGTDQSLGVASGYSAGSSAASTASTSNYGALGTFTTMPSRETRALVRQGSMSLPKRGSPSTAPDDARSEPDTEPRDMSSSLRSQDSAYDPRKGIVSAPTSVYGDGPSRRRDRTMSLDLPLAPPTVRSQLSRVRSFQSASRASSVGSQSMSGYTSFTVPSGAYRPVRDPARAATSTFENPLIAQGHVNMHSVSLRSGIVDTEDSRKEAMQPLPPHLARRLDVSGQLAFGNLTPIPAKLKSDEVLVEVHAVGIDFWDLVLTATMARRPDGYGHIPGRSFCGRVVETGWEVSKVRRGDFVFGLQELRKSAALAEQMVVSKDLVAVAPESELSIEQIAILPLAGVPAFLAMNALCSSLPRGSKVLVLNGHESVGALATQLATCLRETRDIWITAQCPAHVQEGERICRAFGAADVILDEPLAVINSVHESSFDVVLDTVGGRRIYDASRRILHHDGSFITTVGDELGVATASTHWRISIRSLRRSFFKKDKKNVSYWALSLEEREGAYEALARLSELANSGFIQPVVKRVLRFEDAAAAFNGSDGQGEGGLVVRIAAEMDAIDEEDEDEVE